MKKIYSELNLPVKRGSICLTVFILVITFSVITKADSFTHRQSGKVLHGYKTSKTSGSLTLVRTKEEGIVKLNLAQWQVVPDSSGRSGKVVILSIEGAIMHRIETEAFAEALRQEADKGPLFVLIELDTPGGRVDLAQQISAAITNADNVQTIVYIKGAEYGGALSAGAAVSLSADKIYMARNSVIGAATMITGNAETMKKAFGEAAGEKYDSAWRARLAGLAEQNDRSGLLARAMVDKDIEVVEVEEKGKSLFIDPVNKSSSQKVIKTWSKKGSLLTLTAAEAVNCGFADDIAESLEELIRKEGVENAPISYNKDIQKAASELKRARGQLGRIRKSVDLKIKKSDMPMYRAEALKTLRAARREFKTLVSLAGKYPDLNLDIRSLEDESNSIEAAYLKLKSQRQRR